ncbi:WhiB family transcriptional regulator [Pseudonocardia sp.]|uniref:WhiB family transcriptional regulator n=1 Tax=Pseudonocardia sp. TaxID=60912 RepID=UPI0039C973BC
MVATGDWRVAANCRNGDPDRLFVRGAKQRAARAICRGCPVLTQCLAKALDEKIEFGVWGGMTERERRVMLKRRPEVTCWETFLGNASAAREPAKVTAAGAAPAASLAQPIPLAAVRKAARLAPVAGQCTSAPAAAAA